MKKTTFLKTMLLLCALIVGGSSAWADDTYSKVTSTSQLISGKNYLLVSPDGTKSLGAIVYGTGKNVNKDYYGVETVTPSADKSSITNAGNAHVLTLGGEEGEWTFYDNTDGKYVSLIIDGNYVNQSESVEGVSQKWTISISEGVATITSNYKTARMLQYNSSSPRFACYKSSSSQQNGVLYVKDEASSDPSSNLTFANKTPEVNYPTQKTYFQTPSTETGYSETTGTITYEITANTAGATIVPATGVLSFNQGGSVTVKATAAAVAGSFSASSDTYTLTINDTRSDAPLSWSSDEEVRIAKDADDYTLPTLNNTKSLTVTYDITGTEGLVSETAGVITVDTSIEGSATVTVNFAGDDSYKPASLSYNIVVYDATVKGSIYNPYTVADVIALNPTSTSEAVANGYVKGYILGAVDGNTGALKTVSESNDTDTNLAIGDTPTETENYCTVQLSKGAIREALKTKNQTYNIGVAQILVKGDIKKYCGKPGVRDLTEGSKVGEYVAISSVGMATYYTDCALDFTGYDDMYAYVAAVEGDKVNFTRVKKVPANTAVVLRNPSEAAAAHTVPVATSPEDVTSAMTGTLTGIAALATEAGNNINYILNTGDEGVGFYYANGLPVGVHKAYLTVGAGARAFIGFDDDATGIQQMERNAQNNDKIFNLAGQRVAQPTKGLYIVNGKKVIIK